MGSYDSSQDFQDVKNYEVGYKKPPKANQYKKGQSGNPKGPTPEPKTLKDSLACVLSEKISIKDNGKTKKVRVKYALAKSLVREALSGNFRRMEFIFRYFADLEMQENDDKASIETPEQREIRDKRRKLIIKQLEMLEEQEAESLLENNRKVEHNED